MKGVAKWWSGLDSVGQFRFALFFFVLIILLYFLMRGTVKGLSTGLGNTGELAALALSGIYPTYTNASYVLAADELYTAMKGWGTNETKVFNVFSKMNNNADMIKLDIAYGIRDKKDLRAWIKNELTASELQQLNSNLISKGITKLF